MKIHKEKQYIVTVNSEYVRLLYKQQTGEKKSQDEVLYAVIKNIDDFLEGKLKRIVRFLMPDGSFSFTITSLAQYNLQERRKAKRRKR
jgi:hypothetical protein